ncbi:MAG: hypothetical protein LBU79_04115 [Planctomycetota bacterium]|nr:hypothetical protein [Planctomycetota bacterium]
MKKSLLLGCIILVSSFFPHLDGAEPFSLRPSRRPLAILHLTRADDLKELLQTPAAELLPGKEDWRLRPPGLAPLSLQGEFFQRLAQEGGEDVWYGQLDPGHAAITWVWPVDASLPVAERLRLALGVEPEGLYCVAVATGRDQERLWLASDRSTFSVLSAQGDPLLLTLPLDQPGLAVWLDPLPLAGIAALVSGVDIRRNLALLGFDLPSAVQARFTSDGTDLGLSLRLEGLYRSPVSLPPLALPLSAPAPEGGRGEADLGLTLVAGEEAGSIIPPPLPLPPGLSSPGLSLARLTLGLDLGSSFPGLAGNVELADGPAARRFGRRLGEWLLFLAADPGLGVGVEGLGTGEGEGGLAVDLGGLVGRFGPLEETTPNGGGRLAFRLHSARTTPPPAFSPWPAQLAGEVGRGAFRWRLEWDIALSPAARGFFPSLPAPLLFLLAKPEVGSLTLGGGDLRLETPRGVALALALAFWERAREEINRPGFSTRAAARRLGRFLDDWRESRFGVEAKPPGAGRALPAGVVGGYRFQLVEQPEWRLLALPVTAGRPELSLDARGKLESRSGGGAWQPFFTYREEAVAWAEVFFPVR